MIKCCVDLSSACVIHVQFMAMAATYKLSRRYFCGGSFCFMSWCLNFLCCWRLTCVFIFLIKVTEWPPIGKIAAHSAYDMFHGISA